MKTSRPAVLTLAALLHRADQPQQFSNAPARWPAAARRKS